MLNDIKLWFQNYTKTFYSENTADDRNVLLKAAHSIRVSQLALDIAAHEDFSAGDQELAQVMGLLHDIGRFEQYKRYQTFDDHKSVNHGEVGAEVLQHIAPLSHLPKTQQTCICDVTRFHNRITIPSNLNPRTSTFLRAIRDADKIDIFRLSHNYFSQRTAATKNRTLELHVEEGTTINDKIYSAVLDGKLAIKQDIKTLNDFKALQLSWIFDINFVRSFELLHQHNAIQKLYSTLPKNDIRSQNIFNRIMEFLTEKLPSRQETAAKYI